MANIVIVVGTESGQSQMVADTLNDELLSQGHECELVEEAELDSFDIENREVILICTSTHGDGELPDNIIPFHDALKEQKPDLSHIKYGVIALGDQTYHQTFCQAGKEMDQLLASLGAVKVGERLEIDACTQPLPDEDALEWANEWLKEL